MYTTGLENRDPFGEKKDDTPTLKWRRSGRDRRMKNVGNYYEEKRGLIGRRIDWFGIVASIIFPRHSKIK